MTNQNLSLAAGFVQIEAFTLPVYLTVILHSMNNRGYISLYTYISILMYTYICILNHHVCQQNLPNTNTIAALSISSAGSSKQLL